MARLETYLAETRGDLTSALRLYEYNTRLSEAFYTPLQSVEVCLRNTLNEQMSVAYGPGWLHSGTAPLMTEAQRMIDEALAEIRKPKPIPPDDVIAELKFAFWVGLLGPKYDATLWRKALYKGFLGRSGKKRSEVHGRFNALRRFRNRVAHHEPVFNRAPAEKHDEIIDAIGWMCGKTSAWTLFQSRVPAVLGAG